MPLRHTGLRLGGGLPAAHNQNKDEVDGSTRGRDRHLGGQLDLGAAPSLYIRNYTLASCMGSQSFGIEAYATGTVIITAAASDCVVGEIEAQTVDAEGVATEYHGVFAAEPRK